jgi:hypothetical protein
MFYNFRHQEVLPYVSKGQGYKGKASSHFHCVSNLEKILKKHYSLPKEPLLKREGSEYDWPPYTN